MNHCRPFQKRYDVIIISLFKGINPRKAHNLQKQGTLKQNTVVILHELGKKNIPFPKGKLQKLA